MAATAADSPRLRANHNIHPVLEDPVQRFFNAMQPGTYVRPHRHSTPPRWELFVVLRGALALLVLLLLPVTQPPGEPLAPRVDGGQDVAEA